jgi:TolB protein
MNYRDHPNEPSGMRPMKQPATHNRQPATRRAASGFGSSRFEVRGLVLLLAFCLALLPGLARAQQTLQIERYDPTKVVPVSMSGFTGEVQAALKFDLEIAGFEFVAPDKALFLISGSNSDRLEGRLIDRFSNKSIIAKAYAGDAPRRLAHAFADEVVEAVTGKKGIAQTRIAYKVDTGATSEIVVADYDGYNAQPVTNDKVIVAAPTWVPGRRMLFYTSYKLNNPDIYSHDLQTGRREIVARYSGLNTSAAISPDGTKVAMILSKAGSPDLYVSDLNGKNLVQLTKTRASESSPCWSPDGKTICFVSDAPGRATLYTIPAAGGEMRRLTTTSGTTEPDWSPDGKTIIFTVTGRGFDLYIVPASGGQPEFLVAGEDPSWAPNSRTVIFTRRIKGTRVLSLLDVPTKRIKDIKQMPGNCSQPSWAR